MGLEFEIRKVIGITNYLKNLNSETLGEKPVPCWTGPLWREKILAKILKTFRIIELNVLISHLKNW